MRMLEITLAGLGGQRCDTIIRQRENGSVYVTFTSQPGYGHPSLDLNELRDVLRRCDVLVAEVTK